MDKKYFKNCTDAHIKLYARYDAYTQNSDAPLSMKPTIKQAIKYLEEHGNIGDTSLEVIHEDKRNVVYLSIDSGIKVMIVVNKNEFAKSSSLELA